MQVFGVTRRMLIVAALGVTFLAPTPPVAAAVEPPATPWTWGANSYGELGTGGTATRLTPAAVGLDDVVDVHGGREHVVVLRSDGTVWAWGSNQHGQLGVGGSANRSTPVQVPGLSGIVAVETGHNHSMALSVDGSVWSWGFNSDGQLGDGTTTLRRTPVPVSGLNDAVAIAGGRDMAYAIRADGTVVGWGRNDEGQLGDGTTTRRLTPVRVGTLTSVVDIAGGRDHGLAVRSDGSVWSWGSNDYGQLGLGNAGAGTDRLLPVEVSVAATVEVIAGAHHSYVRSTDGSVWSWGRNYRANLGDGTKTQRTRAVRVAGVSDAVSIASGRDHGLAVVADGRVLAWGENGSGQLGDPSLADQTSAIVVPGVTDAVKAGGGGSAYSVVLVGEAEAPPNRAPVPRIAVSCQFGDCTFSGTASSDPDGTVVAWEWQFDDGATASGPQTSRTALPPGAHEVALTVTDDDGTAATATESFEVQAPVTGEVDFVGAASQNANTMQPTVEIPASVQAGSRLLLVVTTNRAATLTVPTGWSTAGQVSDGTDVRSWLFTREAPPGAAGSRVQVTLDAYSKTATHLVAYRGAGQPVASSRAETATTAQHAAPGTSVSAAGSTVLWCWVDKVSSPHGWELPEGVTDRGSTQGSGGGLVTSVVGDRTSLPPGGLAAVSAGAGVASGKAISWTVVVPPS